VWSWWEPLLSLAVFFVALGIRPDAAEALRTWRFDLKVVLVLVALGPAFACCIALSRPVTSGRRMAPVCRWWPWRCRPSDRARRPSRALRGRPGWSAATPWSASSPYRPGDRASRSGARDPARRRAGLAALAGAAGGAPRPRPGPAPRSTLSLLRRFAALRRHLDGLPRSSSSRSAPAAGHRLLRW